MYMRTYEILWQLERNTLALGDVTARINTDAQLAARLVRAYSKDWLGGAGRFACLCLPYLMEAAKETQQRPHPWNDSADAGKGGIPDGLVEIDFDESEILHPSEDPVLSGTPADALPRRKTKADDPDAGGAGTGEGGVTGRKSVKRFRDPVQYADILRGTGVIRRP